MVREGLREREGNLEGRNMEERTMGRDGQWEKELGGEGEYERVKGKRMEGCRKGG